MQKRFYFFMFILLSVGISGCSHHSEKKPVSFNEKWATPIAQGANLYQVDEKLYRSEQLSPADYPLIKAQGIRTLINLRFFDRTDDKQAFGNTDLHLVNSPLLTWAITPHEVAKVLYDIKQNQQQGAVLVHCYHGADRTGLVVAMYRVIYQNWSLADAKQEMMDGPYGFHSIWKNIPNFFTQKHVEMIKSELTKLQLNKNKEQQ